MMQLRISFRSRSDLVLDADHSLDFTSNLVLQACISLYSVLGKSGAWMFLPRSFKNAVAQLLFGDIFWLDHWRVPRAYWVVAARIRFDFLASFTACDVLSIVPCYDIFQVSGISKPRFCKTYVLQFGALHENNGKHNFWKRQRQLRQPQPRGWLLDSQKSQGSVNGGF